jgi:cell division protein FtsW (lipid II flippase)
MYVECDGDTSFKSLIMRQFWKGLGIMIITCVVCVLIMKRYKQWLITNWEFSFALLIILMVAPVFLLALNEFKNEKEE